ISQDLAGATMASLISISGGVAHVSDLEVISLHAGSQVSAIYTVNGSGSLFERGTNIQTGSFSSLVIGTTTGKVYTRDNSLGVNYTAGGVESRPIVVPTWGATVTCNLSQGRDFRLNANTAIAATVVLSNTPVDVAGASDRKSVV